MPKQPQSNTLATTQNPCNIQNAPRSNIQKLNLTWLDHSNHLSNYLAITQNTLEHLQAYNKTTLATP